MPPRPVLAGLLLLASCNGGDGTGADAPDDDAPVDDGAAPDGAAPDDADAGTDAPAGPVGIAGDSILLPFPSMHLMREDPAAATGWRVAIPEGLLPVSDFGTPLPLDRFNHRDGFSTAQPLVVLFPDQHVDPASLPGEADLAASLDPGATVRIIDLATGERIPLFAEPDLAPEVTGPQNRTLIIRPMRALEFATRYAVVLTTGIRLRGGGNLAPPEHFAALRDGTSPHPSLDAWVDHYDGLLDALEGHGVPRDDLALAWDFQTASDESMHATFRRVLEATEEDLPDDPAFEPTYEVESVEDATTNPDLNEHVWKRVRGTFSLASFVGPDKTFELDEDGLPVPQGREDVVFLVVVPASARAGEPGTFGVLVYGHGLMDSPEWPLGDDADGDAVQRLADEMHWIVIGTEWRGLSERDEVDAAACSVNFGLFPTVTERLQQGVSNAIALARLVRTRFRDADFLEPEAGGGSLVDPERVVYYGISLGGIEGATLVANSDVVRHGIFHVGAGAWTTMLERSSNWEDYDRYMRQWMPDPVDRQVSYAASQILWDPVDPITHVTRLRDEVVLWQEAMGDAQVSNLATEMIARSVGVPLLQPSIDHPCCIDEADGPLPAGSSALVQFDPGCGRPAPGNRPAEDNDAHGNVRRREETLAQIRAFFAPGSEGAILPPCGEAACVWTDCGE